MEEKKKFDFENWANKVEKENTLVGQEDNSTNRQLRDAAAFVSYKGTDTEETQKIKDEKSLLEYFKQSLTNSLARVKSVEDLNREIEQGFTSPIALRGISRQLHAIDPNYLKIISYFKDMFHTRYMVIPTAVESDTVELQEESYSELMNIVDGLALETLVPKILESLYIDGIVGIYFDFDEQSKALLGTILPASRVRSSFQTMYGTNVVEFDFTFFDAYTGENLDKVLNSFPVEFGEIYRKVSKDQDKWALLDPTKSAALRINNLGTPPFISALSGIIEFQNVRENELKKGTNELKKVLINEIPLDQNGTPIFDLGEIQHLTRAMRAVLKNKDIDIMTAFGKTTLHSLQDEGKAENKRITQAFSTIYSASGVNPAIFSGLTDGAIEASREADKSFVWSTYKEIELVLNLIVSNLLVANDLEARFQFLPITMHGEAERVKIYRESASFGIGKLDAIVAAGIRQSDIKRRHALEQFLDLDNILTPLKSSHTTPGTDEVVKENEEEEEVIIKEEEVAEVKE